MADLERELETYKKALPSLLAEVGRYVLVFEDQIDGTFESYADAIQSGYQKHGVKPFLVKRIATDETIAFFTRELGTECQA
jgi:hypothetical protein